MQVFPLWNIRTFLFRFPSIVIYIRSFYIRRYVDVLRSQT